MAALIGRLILAAVFAVSGLAKLADRRGSQQTARDFGVPDHLVASIAVCLPVLELAIAVLLLPDVTASWAAIGGFVLLAGFSLAIAFAIAHGRRPDCHCFGQLHSAPAGWAVLLRDVSLAAVAAFVAFAGWGAPGPDAIGWLPALSTSGALAVAAGLALAFSVAFQAWFSLQLLRQNGRLLLRIENLERRAGVQPDLPVRSPAVPKRIVGQPAPAFTMATATGKTVALGELADRARPRPLVFLFTSPSCGPCTAFMPEFVQWTRAHEEAADVFLVIRGSDSETDATARSGIGPDRVLRDSELVVWEAYGVTGTPSAVAVGSTDARFVSDMAQGSNQIRALLEELFAPLTLSAVTSDDPASSSVQHRAGRSAPADRPLPEFELPSPDGTRTITPSLLTAARGLIVFWNPSCGFCQQALLELKALEARTGAGSLLLISQDGAQSNRALGLRAPIGLDDGAVAASFGSHGTPSAVLVDPAHGRIVSDLALGADQVFTLAKRLPRVPGQSAQPSPLTVRQPAAGRLTGAPR